VVRVAVAVAASILVVITSRPVPSVAQPYTWTDDAGVVHYTADPRTMPPQYRPDDPGTPPPTTAAEPAMDVAPVRPPPAASMVVPFSPGQPIVVTARLNGVPIALLLDTGADRTLLSPAAVARAGYAGMIVPSEASVRLLGVTGSAVASQVTVPILDVAGAQIGPLSLIVHDAGLGTLDGLLGRDVLDAFTVTIDAAAGRAILTPR
jgi:hypothetical protein